MADISQKNVYTKMVNEQSIVNEVIAQAVHEAARLTMQAMVTAGTEGTQKKGPWLGRPVMKQPTLNWEAEDKYNELKNFRLEEKQYIQIL